MITAAYYESPLGVIEIQATSRAVTSILFDRIQLEGLKTGAGHPILEEAVRQLDAYFRGERKEFTLPVEMQGTPFQHNVWQQLRKIPYGVTHSYRQIASAAGSERAVRAVGSANSRNKIMIVIPCHRVIGANGTLTGYAGGLWRKEWLLRHERS